MAKRKKPAEPPDSPDAGGAGAKYKNVGIPVSLWEQLKAAAEDEERSVNWMAKRAIQELLKRRARGEE